jgi:hypothetical protein
LTTSLITIAYGRYLGVDIEEGSGFAVVTRNEQEAQTLLEKSLAKVLIEAAALPALLSLDVGPLRRRPRALLPACPGALGG